MTFSERWALWTQRTERELSRLLSAERIHPHLGEAMRYSVMAGGKRLRPMLVLAAANLAGGEEGENRALPLACGVEMIHTYSLIHDDLPAMDNDDYRRGRLTNHRVYGEAIAILAGDGLLTCAFETMLFGCPKDAPLPYVQAVREIALRAGVGGMVAGQTADLLAERETPETQDREERLLYIHAHKTADMIVASLAAGALSGGMEIAEVEALRRYGEGIGMVFQICDDLLDVSGDQAKMGKTLGKDERDHKLTFPTVYGVEASRCMAKERTESAILALEPFGSRADYFRDLARYLVNRQN